MRVFFSSLIAVGGLVALNPVHGLDRGSYTFEKLDTVWKTSAPALSGSQKPYEFFTRLDANANGAEVPPVFCNSDDEFEQAMCEAANQQISTQPSGAGQPSRVFAIFPLSGPEGATLYPRLIGLQRYLNRQDEYQIYRTERLDSSRQTTLNNRRLVAQAELFLANIRLYYADSNLSGKCTRMKRAREYWVGLGSNPKAPALLNILQSHIKDALARLSDSVINEVKDPIVCRLVSVKSKAAEKDAIISLTTSKLREAIEAELRLKQSGIENAAKPIQDLNNRLQGRGDNGGIPLLTDEIFKLELDISRAAGNMSLVAGDKYRLQAIVDNSKTKPEEAAGSKIPVQIETSIKEGPEKLTYARSKILLSFDTYRNSLQAFLKYIKDRRADLCVPGGKSCPKRCEALVIYEQPGNTLEERLRPLDPAQYQGDRVQNPKDYLDRLKTDLGYCLDDMALTFDSNQNLSPAEQYQLKFSRDAQTFYPALLR